MFRLTLFLTFLCVSSLTFADIEPPSLLNEVGLVSCQLTEGNLTKSVDVEMRDEAEAEVATENFMLQVSLEKSIEFENQFSLYTTVVRVPENEEFFSDVFGFDTSENMVLVSQNVEGSYSFSCKLKPAEPSN